MTPEQAAGLRAWAGSGGPSRGGVELLIRSRLLSNRMDPYLVDPSQDPEVSAGYIWPDIDAAWDRESQVMSSGERKVLAVARALLSDLNGGLDVRDLDGIDPDECQLICRALAMAMGMRVSWAS